MNGPPAHGPIVYTFPKVDKIDRATLIKRSTCTLQAAVAAVIGYAATDEMHVDQIAAALLNGKTIWTEIHGYRSQRSDEVNILAMRQEANDRLNERRT